MDKNEKAMIYSKSWEEINPTLDFNNMTPEDVCVLDYLAGYNQCEQDNNKLKQEHAEMVEYLKDLEKSFTDFESYSLKERLEQLLNKIKENGN